MSRWGSHDERLAAGAEWSRRQRHQLHDFNKELRLAPVCTVHFRSPGSGAVRLDRDALANEHHSCPWHRRTRDALLTPHPARQQSPTRSVAAQDSSLRSLASAGLTYWVQTRAPECTSNPTATASGPKQVQLSWPASADNIGLGLPRVAKWRRRLTATTTQGVDESVEGRGNLTFLSMRTTRSNRSVLVTAGP